MSGTPLHSTVFPHQTGEVMDRGSGSSGNSVQLVHTGPDGGTERQGDGKPLAHSDALLYDNQTEWGLGQSL